MSWVEAAVYGGASLLGGMMGAGAAEHAADLQAGASQAATQLQRDIFNTTNAQQTPYRSAGYGALNKINSMMGSPYIKYDYQGNAIGTAPNAVPVTGQGLGGGGDVAGMIAGMLPANLAQTTGQTTDLTNPESDYLTHQFNAEDFQNNIDPGFAWRLKMGQAQAARQANLGGGALSGNALAGLQDYTQGQASQEYGNAFNRYQTQRSNIYNTLASIAGLGQTSLGQTTQAGIQAGANIGSSMQNAGAAQAGGIIGSANALSGGIQGAGNAYMLSQLLKPQGQTFSDNSGWSGGGSGIVNVPSQGNMSIGDYFRT